MNEETRGGTRVPNNPAPVSGPGALSARTDGGPTQPAKYMPGLGYGQGGQNYDNQVSAPLAGNPMSSPAGQGMSGEPEMVKPTSLDAPTQFPDEAGTSGIDRGPGGGSELMMDMPRFRPNIQQTLEKAAMFDDSGEAELILNQYFKKG
jgi:hypothetical protein